MNKNKSEALIIIRFIERKTSKREERLELYSRALEGLELDYKLELRINDLRAQERALELLELIELLELAYNKELRGF